MEKAAEWKDIAMESLSAMWLEIAKVFPSIIGAIIILVLGWLLTKLLVRIIRKALKLAKANKLDDKLNDIEIVEGKKLSFDTIKIVSNFVKWTLYVILIIMVSDILNLTMISEQISNLLGYLPQLFAALVIFTIGLILANAVKKGIRSFFESMDLSGAKIISQVVFFIILVFTSITALNQAGVDTEIITSNITMILAAFLLAFALAFGFGAQRVVGDLLKTFYARRTYEIGKVIEFNGVKGEVEAIDNICITLKTEKGKLVLPIKDLVESQVKVQDEL
ncbi:mechanosensitive ion channel family protein [Seonamhaeicola aphaedonensis]|uniref:Mechanosensitive ion channel-like protein n=1 Tax=Seonamhaeicola aphaedonensis TaxID=1461338 RepID=A0A3D9H8Z2_9FLAO|nr:mechanosensitive ion channel domain-containing protein [Seonamhaeicola aphaedonensis]RED45937.1 mechanosensitive ion channel-like protein [Seonamhaeicola aphaedonensis]